MALLAVILLVVQNPWGFDTRRLRQLQDEQQKLLQPFYKGGVSDEVLVAEQERIETEQTQARKLVEAASHEAQDVFEALDEILRLVGAARRWLLQPA